MRNKDGGTPGGGSLAACDAMPDEHMSACCGATGGATGGSERATWVDGVPIRHLIRTPHACTVRPQPHTSHTSRPPASLSPLSRRAGPGLGAAGCGLAGHGMAAPAAAAHTTASMGDAANTVPVALAWGWLACGAAAGTRPRAPRCRLTACGPDGATSPGQLGCCPGGRASQAHVLWPTTCKAGVLPGVTASSAAASHRPPALELPPAQAAEEHYREVCRGSVAATELYGTLTPAVPEHRPCRQAVPKSVAS